jgi:hypothetical protein
MVPMKNIIRKIINSLPYINRIIRLNSELGKTIQAYNKLSCYPPGHYYSPIVNTDDIKKYQDVIWTDNAIVSDAIQLNIYHQLELLNIFSNYYAEMPFKEDKNDELRYYFNNTFFNSCDSIVLYSIIRHFKPERIIEIGSGFSSAVLMDINQLFFENRMQLRFIEPFPDRLYSLIKNEDFKNIIINAKNVQEIPVELFMELDANDILFIDSTHVCKTGSDVNYLFFQIIPVLRKGVLIHIHDVFYPFEYPVEWVYGGRNWNEIYLLKAFLMFNNDFSIEIFNNFIYSNYLDELRKLLPLAARESGGSIWLRKM